MHIRSITLFVTALAAATGACSVDPAEIDDDENADNPAQQSEESNILVVNGASLAVDIGISRQISFRVESSREECKQGIHVQYEYNLKSGDPSPFDTDINITTILGAVQLQTAITGNPDGDGLCTWTVLYKDSAGVVRAEDSYDTDDSSQRSSILIEGFVRKK